jgi:hypothetical protein
LYVSPVIDVLSADYDQVDWDSQVSQSATQTDVLVDAILDLWLDHEQVDIASRSSFAAGVRAKEDDSCIWCGVRKAPGYFVDQPVVSHRG